MATKAFKKPVQDLRKYKNKEWVQLGHCSVLPKDSDLIAESARFFFDLREMRVPLHSAGLSLQQIAPMADGATQTSAPTFTVVPDSESLRAAFVGDELYDGGDVVTIEQLKTQFRR